MKALSKKEVNDQIIQRPLDFLIPRNLIQKTPDNVNYTNLDFLIQKESNIKVHANLDFLIQKEPNIHTNLDFLIRKDPDNNKVHTNLDFLIRKDPDNKVHTNLDFLIQKDLRHDLPDLLVNKEVVTNSVQQKTINDVSDILANNSLTEAQKVDTIHSYIEKGISAGWFALDVAKSFLLTSCKMIAMIAAFYSLGCIAAAAATAGSAGQFLSTLVSLGYGAVSLSGPLLGMLTKGLGENLIKNLGAQTTISGVLHAAKKAGATAFLDSKLNDGYVKSFFVRLGVNPTNVTNETVVKELAHVFLTVAPSMIGMAGLLPGGMMFLVGDPITALTLNYTMRAGITAYSGAPSLRNVVSNIVGTTSRVKNHVVSEFLTTDKDASEMKIVIDNAIKDEMDLQTLVDAELKTQQAVVTNGVAIDDALFIADSFKQTPETVHAISTGKLVGLGAVALAFGTSGGTSAVMGIIAPSIAGIANATIETGMLLGSSSLAQTFVVDVLMKTGLKKVYQKIWQGTNVAQEKNNLLRELNRNYRRALKDGDEKIRGHIATTILYTLYGFGTVYDVKSIEKVGKPFLIKIATEAGIRNAKNLNIDQLRGAILAKQYENLNKISESVTQVTTGVALNIASHVIVQGIRTYSSGEFSDMINKANKLSKGATGEVLKTAQDLGVVNANLSAEALKKQTDMINAAKLSQKATREATMLAGEIAKLKETTMKASEVLAKQQAFQEAMARRIQAGKTVGGTTIIKSEQTITGYSFSTKELLDKIDKEFGDTKFASLLDVFASTIATSATSKILDFVPGMAQLRTLSNTIQFGQYAQTSADILEKMAQLGEKDGIAAVMNEGFKTTYASNLEGIQSITLENAARLAKENLGQAGAAFESFVKENESVKSELATGIKNVLLDMLQNNIPLTSNEIYTRVGKLLLVGDSVQAGTKAHVLQSMGKSIYMAVMGE